MFDGAALATEGKMVPGNAVLISQMCNAEDSTLAEELMLCIKILFLSWVCRVLIHDGTCSPFTRLCSYMPNFREVSQILTLGHSYEGMV